MCTAWSTCIAIELMLLFLLSTVIAVLPHYKYYCPYGTSLKGTNRLKDKYLPSMITRLRPHEHVPVGLSPGISLIAFPRYGYVTIVYV